MKNPSEIEAEDRSEMICPVCFKHSLEQHTRHKDYETEQQKIIHATRCGNPDCDKGLLKPETVRTQYSPPSKIEQVVSDLSTVELIGLSSIIAFVLFAAVVGLPFGSDSTSPPVDDGSPTTGSEVQFTGEIITKEDFSSITVSMGSEETELNSNGRFTMVQEPGEYTLTINGESEYATDTIPITVKESGGITIKSDKLYSVSDYTITEDNTIIIQRTKTTTTEYDQIVQDTTYEYPINSLANTDDISVEIEPILSDSPSHSVDLTQTSTVSIPENTTSQSLDITSNVKSTERSLTREYNGEDVQEIDISGNIDPSEVELNISREGGEPVETRDVYFDSSSSADFNVISRNASEFKMELQSVGRSNIKTYSGSSDGVLRQSIEPGSGKMAEIEVTGSRTENSESIQGVVTDREVRVDYKGSQPPSDPTISFTDGDIVEDRIEGMLLSANASDGFSSQSTTLIENSNASRYRIDFNTNVSQNPNLTKVGYIVNGERYTVDPDRDSVEIDLNSNETVKTFVEASQENLEGGDFKGNESIEIESVEVQKNNLRSGESTGVRYLATNPTNRDIRYTAYLYKNGSKVGEKTTVIPSGAFEYAISFDTRLTFNSEGINSVAVNQYPPVGVSVGDASIDYGKISSQTEAFEIRESATIGVDTNGDGSVDCETSIGGSCSLSPDSLSTTVPITLENVSDVEYNISYTSVSTPTNLFVETDGDGENEFEYFGPISEDDPVTTQIDLSKVSTELVVTTGNDREFNYDISVFERQTAKNPVIYTNGVEQKTLSSFTNSKTVSLPNLPSNEYTMRIETENDAPIEGTISWRKPGESNYPATILNGERVCEQKSCTLSTLTKGTNTISFEDWKQLSFEYTITYNERQIADSVDVVVNGETQRTILNTGNVVEEGVWKTKTSANFIPPGTNNVRLEADGSNVSGSLNIQFNRKDAKNPVVTLSNTETSTEYAVESDDLTNTVLTEPTRITIDKEDLSTGVNKISFNSSNNGIYRVIFETTNDTSN